MKQVISRLKSKNYLEYLQKIEQFEHKSSLKIFKLNQLSAYTPPPLHDYDSKLSAQSVWKKFIDINGESIKASPENKKGQESIFKDENNLVLKNSNFHLQFSQGIRYSLYEIFDWLKKNQFLSGSKDSVKTPLILPRDVYPVYQLIASECGLDENVQFYDTFYLRLSKEQNFNTKKIQFMKELLSNYQYQQSSVLLITDPNIVGDLKLDQNLIDLLVKWLKQSEKRILIIDTVYTMNYQNFQKYSEFLQENLNVFILSSFSKTYQLPQTFGFNVFPKKFSITFQLPDTKANNKAISRMNSSPHMPSDQLQNIKHNWDLLSYKIKQIDQKFTIPEVKGSYIAPVQLNITDLYQKHGILGVDPMVYDINMQKDLSIVSCLNAFDNLYHVTVLSNFSVCYDKYSQSYCKAGIKESTYADKFFLLTADELNIGINKSEKLLSKVNTPGNQQIVLKTNGTYLRQQKQLLQKNTNTGLGYFIEDNKIQIEKVFLIEQNGKEITVEDAYAMSMKINSQNLHSYDELVPRTISILPVAQGCQAKCPFCFSHTSVSADIKQKLLKEDKIHRVLAISKQMGAQRAVITGGGEPTILPFEYVINLIKMCKSHFDRVIMISNGYNLGHMSEEERQYSLRRMEESGLTILAISRHDIETQQIMNLDTKSHKIAQTLSNLKLNQLKLRWVCVIQKGGVEDEASLERYLDNVVDLGGCDEINFKELYVATSEESVYYEKEVSLSLITQFVQKHKAQKIAELPWGSPIYLLEWKGKSLKIAAYTEPSVYWERKNNICRSWNLMSNGELFASLETKDSLLDIEAFGEQTKQIN